MNIQTGSVCKGLENWRLRMCSSCFPRWKGSKCSSQFKMIRKKNLADRHLLIYCCQTRWTNRKWARQTLRRPGGALMEKYSCGPTKFKLPHRDIQLAAEGTWVTALTHPDSGWEFLQSAACWVDLIVPGLLHAPQMKGEGVSEWVERWKGGGGPEDWSPIFISSTWSPARLLSLI